MKATLRSSLGTLLAFGAAGVAHADIVPYSSGDGSLYFNLLDVTNQKSYVLDLNIPISTFNGSGSYTISADGLLTSFLSTGSGNYIWSVFGGDSTGTTAGSTTYFTTSTNLGSVTPPNNIRLYTLYGDEAYLTNINAVLPDDDSVLSLVSNNGTPTYYTTQVQTWNNTGDFTANQTGFGSIGFFSLTTNGGTTAFNGGNNPVTRVAFGNWTLASNGTLSYGETSVVPIPAAVWLLGSGLLGFAGIGRRKANVA
jgi:hypothetical protein